MAKSSKPSKHATPGEPAVASSVDAAASSVSPAISSKPAARKASTATRKRTAPAGGKKAATKTKKTPAPKKAKPVEFTISDEDIRLRAYFIAQHRALSGLSGDSASDWLEARRQLFDEASRQA